MSVQLSFKNVGLSVYQVSRLEVAESTIKSDDNAEFKKIDIGVQFDGDGGESQSMIISLYMKGSEVNIFRHPGGISQIIEVLK